MFTRPTVRPLLCAALLVLAATAAADPAAPRSAANLAADDGALTLEASPAARGFRLPAPAAPVDDERRDETGRPLPTRAQDPYDRRVSDSFVKSSFAATSFRRESAAAMATVRDTQPTTPAAPAPVAAASADADVADPAPAAHAAFAADMLAAPARTFLAAQAAPLWLDGNRPATAAAASVVPTLPAPVSAWAENAFVPGGVRAPANALPAVREAARATGATALAWSTAPATGLMENDLPSVPGPHILRAQSSGGGLEPSALTASSFAPVPAASNGTNGVSGTAYAFGYNNVGQLGNGTTTSSTVPVAVSSPLTGNGVTAISGGYEHGLAIQNGAAYAWGYNSTGQLGNGTTTNSSVPVAVSGLGSGVTAVSGGYNYSLAIQNGAVLAWGDNSTGELGNGTTTQSNVPVAVVGLGSGSGVTAISAGRHHGMAIQNGAAVAWGDNTYGELGNNSTNQSNVPVAVSGLGSGVTAVFAGEYASLAIRNGAAYAWGNNQDGELGNGTTDGSNQNPALVPVAVLNLSTGVTSVAGGFLFSLAVQNGNVFSWGNNSTGQLGNGTTTNTNTPGQVDPADLKNIIAVVAGTSSSYALSSDGSLWVWGNNSRGQLGLGTTTTQYTTPQHLLPPSGYYYSAISSSDFSQFADAILTAGTPVPEPATWLGGALLLAGAGLTLRQRRRPARLA